MKKQYPMKLFVVLMSLLLISLTFPAVAIVTAQPPTTQLGLCIDGSGSIGSGDWTILKDGLANAVQNVLPQDGSVELTIVQFSTTAQVELPPTIVNATTTPTIVTTIQAMVQLGDMTNIAWGLNLTWETMALSPYYDYDLTQIINIATDGLPNQVWFGVDPYTDTTTVRDIAVTEGLDELDAEGITAAPDEVWLRDFVVWPQPGTIAPPYTPGWVEAVTTFEDFADAIEHKFETIFGVGGTIIPITGLLTVVPWLMLAIIIVLVSIQRIHKKIQ